MIFSIYTCEAKNVNKWYESLIECCFFYWNLYIMCMDFRIFKKIPDDTLKNVQETLDNVYDQLKPCLVELTPSERRTYVKIGLESIKFLDLSHRIAVNNSGLFPGFLKISLFRKEFFMANELWKLLAKLDKLREAINDTEILAGNFALETALAFYNTIKIAARHDIPGTEVIYEELKSAYALLKGGRQRAGKKKDTRQPELFGNDELKPR